MAAPTITYLPHPLKVENNVIRNIQPNPLNWAIYTVALGVLAISAPKIFLVVSAGTIIYQVYYFNHLVHSADPTKHQEIREWTIKACQVIGCVAVVFCLKSLPCFWSALVSIKNLDLFHCAGHAAQAGLMIGIWKILRPFSTKAFDLAAQRQWVAMEDYVENYPIQVKEKIASSYREQLRFYIASVIPNTALAGLLSGTNVVYDQFKSDKGKVFSLNGFFNHPNIEEWPIAIHQLQQLPIHWRLSFGKVLTQASTLFSKEEQSEFPDEVKVILINHRLRGFDKIPLVGEDADWNIIVTDFQKLNRDQRWDLGKELFRLLQKVPEESLTQVPEDIRYAALRFCILSIGVTTLPKETMPYANLIFGNLPEYLKVEFGTYLKELIKREIFLRDELPVEMQAKILGTV